MSLGELSPRGTYFPQGVCGSSHLQPTPVSLLALLLALGPCTTTLWPHVLGLPSNAVSGPTFIYLLTRSPSNSSDGRETTWMTLKLTHPSEACLLWECFHVCHLGFFLSYLGSHRLTLGSQMLRKAGLILWCPMGFWVKSVPPPQKLFRIRYSSGSFSNPFWASNKLSHSYGYCRWRG